MSGLLYISEIKQCHGMPGVTVEDAVLEGSKAQLRPVLMVIVVAALGMAPAMLAQGIGSDIRAKPGAPPPTSGQNDRQQPPRPGKGF
jgi:cobalt-zinc-cadmium resistance protein CzcA